MSEPKVKLPKRGRAGPRVSIDCSESVLPSKTKQAFKKECDVNLIVANAMKGALVTHLNRYQPYYIDAADGPVDFHEAMCRVIEARQAFDAMPAHVRDRFANDPGLLLDFLGDPDNADEARKLGLLPSLPSKSPVGAPAEPAEGDAPTPDSSDAAA